jgi:hypothetical protein
MTANPAQSVALYVTLGLVLASADLAWDTVAFWSIMALYWAGTVASRQEGYEQGVAQGFAAYHNMTDEQRAQVKQLMDSVD